MKINFPVIADLDRKVATLYGMVMPGESKIEASRCVFIRKRWKIPGNRTGEAKDLRM